MSDRDIVLALAEGRVPPGVDPGSAEGRHYLAWGAAIKAHVDRAAPPSEATKTAIVTMLRAGGDRRGRSTG